MKKGLCVLLSVVLLLSLLPIGAYAADDGTCPLVIVRGMSFVNGLKRDPGTPEQTDVNVSANLSANGVAKGIARIMKGLVTGGPDGAVNALVSFAATLFDGYACNKNGDSLDPSVGSVSYPEALSNYPAFWESAYDQEEGLVRSAVERYGAENVYYFVYDWRLDTYENAGYLNDLVETALRDHGCEKVDMVCCSMGGIVTLTYLNYYGADKVDSLVSASSTMYGTDVTSDLLTGKILFEEGAATRYLQLLLPDHAGAIGVLSKLKVIAALCAFLNGFAAKYRTRIYNGVLTPVFASMPAFWELVKHEDYEAAKAFIFGDDQSWAGLIAKTDKVQYEVVARRDEILCSAMEGGMKFSILSGYNTPNVPAYESAALQGDGTLETRMMAFGATVSEVGGKLSGDALTGDRALISVDGCINASTCDYPDITWFIKNGGHVGCRYGSGYTEFVFKLLEAQTQPTADTWAQYPRFLQADGALDLAPLTDAPGKWDR